MWEVAEKQHASILTGLRALVVDRKWEVEVVPLVIGQPFGQGKGVAGNPQDLWDREGGRQEDHWQTWLHSPQRA